jgi:hypothetical protein
LAVVMSGMIAKLNNVGAFRCREWWSVRRADLGGGRDFRSGWMGAGGGDVCVPLADDHRTGGSRGLAALNPDGEGEGNQDLAGQFRRN